MPENRASGRRGSWIAIAIASVALAFAIWPLVTRDQTEYPGVSHIRLRDSDSGECIGFIHAEYGKVTIGSIAPENTRRAVMTLTPAGFTIDVHKDGRVVASWTLDEGGEKFRNLTP